ncbi:sigma factor [Nonomuraea sp. MG754425]|uniref:sigma factor n=1 Tax=Nonomuraea sp. MG754425 TaxID=2570319 RepID=UPI001F2E99D5|nr:sigma factor [Nonomuraea sp. MG754425]
MDPATQTFVTHRNLPFTVAYEMLGSAADAEDVLQETWLRWTDADLATVREHRAYLVRIVTRQALDRLRALSRRKESYIGPWLPEPLLTTPDVADDVELADSVSMAMLLVLETLQPTERAVFVLHEVFALINGAPGLLVRVTRPRQRGDRRSDRGMRRERLRHRRLPRTQPREAVTHGTGNRHDPPNARRAA